MKKVFSKIVNFLLNSRIVKFVFIICVWILSLNLLNTFGLLNNVDGNLLVIVNLAMFFFALTVSPTTWVIKGPFGFEAGSNDPKHTHITFNENSHKDQIDIREYGEKGESDRLVEIANKLEAKK